MAARYVLSRSAEQYRFVLKAGNNETLLTSELYTSRQSALVGIASVKANSSIGARYERKVAVNGSPMFNLKAANGQVIGTSELYSSAAGRDAGIQSVVNNGPSAPIDEQA